MRILMICRHADTLNACYAAISLLYYYYTILLPPGQVSLSNQAVHHSIFKSAAVLGVLFLQPLFVGVAPF